jgi:hypothetical protein
VRVSKGANGWIWGAASRRRTWGALLAVALAGGALELAASGTAAASAPRCPPSSAHVLAHGRFVRVYELHAATPASTRIEACVIGRGTRMTVLAPVKGSAPHRSLGGFAFAGTKLAYVEDQFGVDSGSLSIVLADVARRRVLRTLAGVGGYTDAGVLGSANVSGLVLASNGAVAWLTETHGPPASPALTVAVHAASATGAVSTLDEGPDIEVGSLTLSGGTLSWRRGGVKHTAPMP